MENRTNTTMRTKGYDWKRMPASSVLNREVEMAKGVQPDDVRGETWVKTETEVRGNEMAKKIKINMGFKNMHADSNKTQKESQRETPTRTCLRHMRHDACAAKLSTTHGIGRRSNEENAARRVTRSLRTARSSASD